MSRYFEIADLVLSILNDDKKNQASNIDPNLLRGYPGVNKISRKSVYTQQDGSYHRWKISVGNGIAATNYGELAVFDRAMTDHLIDAKMSVRGTHTSYSFDVMEEEFNSGGSRLINHVRNRSQVAKIEKTKKLEAQLWGNAAYADRELVPQGMLYWFPYCASQGFVGTYPTSYTTIAEVDPVIYTGWKSWGDVYAAPTQDDLIDKLTLAMTKTQFMAPLEPMEVRDLSSGYMFGLYCNIDTERAMAAEARLRNDNHGPELDLYHGKAMIRGTPFVEVPYLADNSRDPIFGVNWGVTKNHVFKNYWMKEEKAPRAADQPSAVTFDIFTQNQMICYDRRQGGFNISKAA
jgi:hypothetical protein